MNVAGVSLRSSCLWRAAAVPTVLVFDTYDGGRVAMAECMRELGYRALVLATLEATRTVHASIDIAILDHDPPWSDAIAALAVLRDALGAIPAVVLTSQIEPAAASATIWLRKPAGLDHMGLALRTLLDGATRFA